jgi:hypothetical protein
VLTPFFDPKMLGDLLTWCATCAGSGGAGIPAITGIAAGLAGAAAAVGGIPSGSSAPNPARGDERPLPTGDSHVVPGATGPAGLTVTHSDGAVTVTTPDGTTVSATDTGGNTYAAALPDGSILNGNADGTSTITAVDGATTNYDAAGRPTGSAPPNLAAGGSLNAPSLHHDVTSPTSDGGYNVSHPDGSVDVHRPDGTAIHVDPDGSTWHPLP